MHITSLQHDSFRFPQSGLSSLSASLKSLARLAARCLGAHEVCLAIRDQEGGWRLHSSKEHEPADAAALTDFCRGVATYRERAVGIAPSKGQNLPFLSGFPLTVQDGTVLGVLCLLDDGPRCLSEEDQLLIDELVHVATMQIESARETERSQTTAFWRHLADSHPEAVLVMTKGRVSYANAEAARLYGASSSQALLGLATTDLIAPSHHHLLRERLETLERGVRQAPVSYSVRKVGGEELCVEAVTVPILYEGHKAVLVVVRDVTKRVRAERKIHFQQRLLDTIGEAVIATDADGRIIYWNQAAEGLYGWPREAVLGRPVLEVTPQEAVRDQAAAIMARLTAGEPWTGEFPVQRRDGSAFTARVTNAPLFAEDGTFAGVVGVSRDITPEWQAQQALHEAQQFLGATLDALSSHIAVLGADGTILAVNEAWRRFAEANGGAIGSLGVGANYLTICDTVQGAGVAGAAEVAHRLREVIEGRTDSFMMEYSRHTPGQERWFILRASRFSGETFSRDGAGRVVVAHEDITECKQAERLVAESREKLNMALEAGQMGTWVWDLTTGEISANEYTNQILGISLPEHSSRAIDLFWDLVHSDDVMDLKRAIVLALEARPFDFTYRIVRPDGAVRWVEAKGRVEMNALGEPALMLGTVEDITAYKHAQIALEQSEARWRSLVEANPEPILIVTDLRIAFINAAGVRLLKAGSAEELVGRRLTEFVVEGHHGVLLEQQRRIVHRDEQIEPLLYRIRCLDGEERIVEAFDVPVDYQGQQAALSVIRDVTGQKQYEEGLIEAKERAEEMSRLKDAFLTNLSHEIRTPLTAIMGFAELLIDEVGVTQRSSMQYIYLSGQRLMETLTSMLDLALLESGTMRLQPLRFDLAEAVAETIDLFTLQAAEKQLRLRFAPPPSTLTIYHDRMAVKRVMSNLLSNAIKYTESGEVTVRVDEAGDEVCLCVQDTGIGVSEAFKAHLFEAFKQESSGLGRNYEGMGLGLTITKSLVKMMGGRIEVQSEKGQGSVFTVTLHRRDREPL